MPSNSKPLIDRGADCISEAFYLDRDRADELIETVMMPLAKRALDERMTHVAVLTALHDATQDNQEYAWLSQGVFGAIDKERRHRRELHCIEVQARITAALKKAFGRSDDDDEFTVNVSAR